MKETNASALRWILLAVCIVLCSCAASPRLQESGLNSDFTFSTQTPFDVYSRETRALVEKARVDLNEINRETVLQANAPFELRPPETVYAKTKAGKHQKGVLLIHGLSDSPYLIRPIARHLQSRGYLVRAILLPGHGTVPGDLLSVGYEAWVKAAAYGVSTLRADAEEIYLGGFSTGGALSVLQALKTPEVKGLLLFAPALAVKDRRVALAGLLDTLSHWIGFPRDDVDYAKYESFATNAAYQIHLLTEELRAALESRKRLDVPVFVALSEDDATVDAARTLEVMSRYGTSAKNRIILYTKEPKLRRETFPGVLIQENSSLPKRRILDMSHIAVTIPPDDPHYGINGGYRNCLHYQAEPDKRLLCLHGREAYWGEVTGDNLKKGVLRRLSYNPWFQEMLEQMDIFMQSVGNRS